MSSLNDNTNIESLGKQLEELQRLQNIAFSQLPAESYKHVKEIHVDVNEMLRKFKAGDNKAIDNYLQKYSKIDASNTSK